jgi:hypothetical protein
MQASHALSWEQTMKKYEDALAGELFAFLMLDAFGLPRI